MDKFFRNRKPGRISRNFVALSLAALSALPLADRKASADITAVPRDTKTLRQVLPTSPEAENVRRIKEYADELTKDVHIIRFDYEEASSTTLTNHPSKDIALIDHIASKAKQTGMEKSKIDALIKMLDRPDSELLNHYKNKMVQKEFSPSALLIKKTLNTCIIEGAFDQNGLLVKDPKFFENLTGISNLDNALGPETETLYQYWAEIHEKAHCTDPRLDASDILNGSPRKPFALNQTSYAKTITEKIETESYADQEMITAFSERLMRPNKGQGTISPEIIHSFYDTIKNLRIIESLRTPEDSGITVPIHATWNAFSNVHLNHGLKPPLLKNVINFFFPEENYISNEEIPDAAFAMQETVRKNKSKRRCSDVEIIKECLLDGTFKRQGQNVENCAKLYLSAHKYFDNIMKRYRAAHKENNISPTTPSSPTRILSNRKPTNT